MSDSNRGQLAFIKEVTLGETPAAALKKLRFTDESISFDIDNVSSSEVRSDRQITDLIQTGAESGNGFSFEVSYEAFDEFMESAMADNWVGIGTGTTEIITAGPATADISLDSAADTITIGSSHTIDIVNGQWIKLTGSSNDDGYHLVIDVTGQVLTVQTDLQTTETLTAGETLKGARLQNGVKKIGFSVERFLEDKGDYFGYKGMIVGSFNIVAAASSILTGSMDFIGGEAVAGTSTMGSGVYEEASAFDVMNAVSNVGQIMEGDTLVPLTGVYVQEIGFTINANLRGIQAVGSLYNVDIGQGSVEITGTLNLHYEDLSIYNKYIADQESGLSFKTEDDPTDGVGNAYIYTFPRIKFGTDTVNIPGQNADVIETITWQALRHPTYGYTGQICRFGAGQS